MRVCVLYRPNTEQARKVEEYAHDFEKAHSRAIELIDMDTPQGVAFIELYDALTNPTILALATDGQLLAMWPGPELPLMQEVAGYLAG